MYKDVYGCEGVKVNEEGKFIKSKNGKEVKKTKAYRGEGYYIRYKGESKKCRVVISDEYRWGLIGIRGGNKELNVLYF